MLRMGLLVVFGLLLAGAAWGEPAQGGQGKGKGRAEKVCAQNECQELYRQRREACNMLDGLMRDDCLAASKLCLESCKNLCGSGRGIAACAQEIQVFFLVHPVLDQEVVEEGQ